MLLKYLPHVMSLYSGSQQNYFHFRFAIYIGLKQARNFLNQMIWFSLRDHPSLVYIKLHFELEIKTVKWIYKYPKSLSVKNFY